MAEIDEAVQKNPKAAQEIEEMKDLLGALNDLRKAGIARGSEIRPFRGRQSLGELKRDSNRRGKLKLTISA